MAEFTPINTQEELDRIIADRLSRKESQVRAEFSDYAEIKEKAEKYDTDIAELKGQLEASNQTATDNEANLNKRIDELTAQVKQYEDGSLKRRIAKESGLPEELAGRLNGATEDEMREDAKALKSVFDATETVPLRDTEAGASANDTRAALREMLNDIKF